MLDQNTDRMWYVIGAIVIGAAIIAMGLNIFNESYDSVNEMMTGLTGIASENIKTISVDPLIADGYIPVATADELNNIRKNEIQTFGSGTQWESEYESGLDKKYIQVADIDLSKFDNWVPIGDGVRIFRGSYDGGGYTLSNLNVNNEDNEYTGLFGRVVGSTFTNVRLVSISVVGGRFTGGLIGELGNGSSIRDVSVDGAIAGTGNYIGGIVGRSWGSRIYDSNANCNINSDGIDVGGVVGWIGGNSRIGRIYAEGDIIGKYFVGGLVGTSNNIIIEDSYAIGDVSLVRDGYGLGGLVGHHYNSKLSRSFSIGKVSGLDRIGGLVGIMHNTSNLDTSYYDKSLSGQSDTGKGLGKTTSEMQLQSTYEGWDFDTIWQIQEGQYPTLR